MSEQIDVLAKMLDKLNPQQQQALYKELLLSKEVARGSSYEMQRALQDKSDHLLTVRENIDKPINDNGTEKTVDDIVQEGKDYASKSWYYGAAKVAKGAVDTTLGAVGMINPGVAKVNDAYSAVSSTVETYNNYKAGNGAGATSNALQSAGNLEEPLKGIETIAGNESFKEFAGEHHGFKQMKILSSGIALSQAADEKDYFKVSTKMMSIGGDIISMGDEVMGSQIGRGVQVVEGIGTMKEGVTDISDSIDFRKEQHAMLDQEGAKLNELNATASRKINDQYYETFGLRQRMEIGNDPATDELLKKMEEKNPALTETVNRDEVLSESMVMREKVAHYVKSSPNQNAIPDLDQYNTDLDHEDQLNDLNTTADEITQSLDSDSNNSLGIDHNVEELSNTANDISDYLNSPATQLGEQSEIAEFTETDTPYLSETTVDETENFPVSDSEIMAQKDNEFIGEVEQTEFVAIEEPVVPMPEQISEMTNLADDLGRYEEQEYLQQNTGETPVVNAEETFNQSDPWTTAGGMPVQQFQTDINEIVSDLEDEEEDEEEKEDEKAEAVTEAEKTSELEENLPDKEVDLEKNDPVTGELKDTNQDNSEIIDKVELTTDENLEELSDTATDIEKELIEDPIQNPELKNNINETDPVEDVMEDISGKINELSESEQTIDKILNGEEVKDENLLGEQADEDMIQDEEVMTTEKVFGEEKPVEMMEASKDLGERSSDDSYDENGPGTKGSESRVNLVGPQQTITQGNFDPYQVAASADIATNELEKTDLFPAATNTTMIDTTIADESEIDSLKELLGIEEETEFDLGEKAEITDEETESDDFELQETSKSEITEESADNFMSLEENYEVEEVEEELDTEIDIIEETNEIAEFDTEESDDFENEIEIPDEIEESNTAPDGQPLSIVDQLLSDFNDAVEESNAVSEEITENSESVNSDSTEQIYEFPPLENSTESYDTETQDSEETEVETDYDSSTESYESDWTENTSDSYSSESSTTSDYSSGYSSGYDSSSSSYEEEEEEEKDPETFSDSDTSSDVSSESSGETSFETTTDSGVDTSGADTSSGTGESATATAQ